MSFQPSLLDPDPPAAPAAVERFLAGFAARFAFGEAPTAPQRRAADDAGRELAARLAELKASSTP